MILTNECFIAKTPLDSDYLNVFDNYPSKEFYYNTIKRIYESLTYTFTERSIKEDNGRITFTVPPKNNVSFKFLSECNYLGLKLRNGYRFYFILEIVDQFTNKDTGDISVTYLCKLDSFTENYESLNNSNYNDKNHIVRRHIEETYIDNNELKPLLINTIEEEVETYPTAYRTDTKVLWARIRCNTELSIMRPYRRLDDGTIETEGGLDAYGSYEKYKHEISNNPSSSIYPVFYIPLAYVRVRGFGEPEIVDTCKYATTKYELNNNNSILWQMLDENGKLRGITSETKGVISIELTYYSPYSYYTTTVNNKYLIAGREDLRVSGSVLVIEDSVFYLENSPTASNATVSRFAIDTVTHTPLIVKEESKLIINPIQGEFLLAYNIEDNIRGYSETFNPFVGYIPTMSPSILEKDFGTVLDYEMRLKRYPYKFLTFKVKDNYIKIIPNEKSNNIYLDIIYDNKTCINYKISDSVTRQAKQFNSVYSDSQAIQGLDSGSEYLRNNGFSMLTNVVGGMVGTMTKGSHINSTFKRSVKKGSRLKEVGRETSEYSKHTTDPSRSVGAIASFIDADNSADFVQMPTLDAFNDMVQDCIMVGVSDILYDCDIERLFYDFHYYGINIGKIMSIRDNYHELFDYISTAECSLPFVSNRDQRSEIESAYDRGITRWHFLSIIDEYEYSEEFLNLVWMNKDYVNLSNNMRNYYIAKESQL